MEVTLDVLSFLRTHHHTNTDGGTRPYNSNQIFCGG
jgi:hypothetical protein